MSVLKNCILFLIFSQKLYENKNLVVFCRYFYAHGCLWMCFCVYKCVHVPWKSVKLLLCWNKTLQREEEKKGDCDGKFYLHFRKTVCSPRVTQNEKPIRDLMERKAIAWAQLPADFREAMWGSGRKALSFLFLDTRKALFPACIFLFTSFKQQWEIHLGEHFLVEGTGKHRCCAFSIQRGLQTSARTGQEGLV